MKPAHGATPDEFVELELDIIVESNIDVLGGVYDMGKCVCEDVSHPSAVNLVHLFSNFR